MVFIFFFAGIVLSGPCAADGAGEADIWFEQVFETGAYNMGVLQDGDGFLWFTTSGGLIRYDGYERLVFNEGPGGLTSNFVPCVFEDSEGLLWIVTLSGLDLYNKKTGHISHFQPEPNNPAAIGSKVFNWAPGLITEDQDGRIWVGSKGGVFRYDKKSGGFTHFSHTPGEKNSLQSDDVWSVMTDNTGNVWIGTDKGVDLYDVRSASFTHYRHDPLQQDSLGKGIVYALFQDSAGGIWVGTSEGGLSLFSQDKQTFASYTHDPQDPATIASNEVFSITEDSGGNLWLGRTFSSNVGLERFNRESKTFTLYRHDPSRQGSLSGNIILSSYQDRSGILWIPENTGTVNKVDPYGHRFNLYQPDPMIPGTRGLTGLASVYEDSRGDIWTGGQNGLSRLRRTTGQWQTFKVDPGDPSALWNKYTFSVVEGSQDDFWVATDDGYLSLFDREKGQVIKRYLNPFVNHTARQIIEDRTNPNLFWFGVEGYGLFNFNKQTGNFNHIQSDGSQPHGLANDYIQTIVQDANNVFWVQTQGGLHRFDAATGSFERFVHDPGDPKGISGDVVNDIFIDSRNRYWVSTDSGLNIFNPVSGQFKSFGEKSGFSTMAIKAIQEDRRGLLWLGSDDGLFVFDPETEKVRWHYTRADGLQGNSFSLFGCSAIMDSEGRLWFVGLRGANSFFPENIHHNSRPPGVYLVSLSQGGDELVSRYSVSSTKQLNLSWKHNFFEFEYVGLNFSQPEKNRYRYKLEGWDSDWYYAGSKRFSRYSGLAGGDYTLKVMASNNDGVWSSIPATLAIHVDTPFWRTLWFYTIITVSIFGLSAVFYFLRVTQLKRFNKELKRAYLDVTRAEKKYRSIFENAIEGIFQVSMTGQILSANPAAATIIGFKSPAEMQEEVTDVRDWLKLTRRDWHTLVSSLRDHGTVSDFEIEVRRTTGEFVWLSVNLRGIYNESGEIISLDGIMEDITVRKNAAEELQLHSDHLEQLVSERTREYQDINKTLHREMLEKEKVEEELLRAKKLESIGVLAGGIAHDFNNLMTVVLGNINIAQLKKVGAPSPELDNAVQALNRARLLTQKFITFSSGGNPIKKIMDIESVTRSAVDLALAGSSLNAEFTVVAGLWKTSVDEDLISQAMYNIVENSKQAMAHGGTLHIEITNYRRKNQFEEKDLPIRSGDYVLIEFQDYGCGISSEHLSRIFDPYFTTAEMGAKKGKGLGLTIAYSIIKKHGGDTYVDSTVGKGTRVRLFLPAIGPDRVSQERHEDTVSAFSSGGTKRILLMDDEEMLRDIARLMLERMAHEVVLADDGESAIRQYRQALAEEKGFDLVILDLTIPGGIGGKEVVSILKDIDPGVKAVVSSGYAEDPVMADFEKYGFVGVLSKPYDMNKLQSVLGGLA